MALITLQQTAQLLKSDCGNLYFLDKWDIGLTLSQLFKQTIKTYNIVNNSS